MLNLTFHHIGIASSSIEKDIDIYSSLGYQKHGEAFKDEYQGIIGQFLHHKTSPKLELLSDLDGSKTIKSLMTKGMKIYHLAYSTNDIELAINYYETIGAIMVTPIKNAVYFDKAVFLMLPNKQLIEIVKV